MAMINTPPTNSVQAYLMPTEQDHISHELRISLTGILGASYLLEQTELNEQQRTLLKLITASAKRLATLADELA